MSGAGYRDGRLGGGDAPASARQIGVLAAFIVLVFAIFSLRLFQLQIVEGAALRSRSDRNRVRTTRVDAPRGDIVDREGRVLATTRPAFRVQVIPNELLAPDTTFRVLGELLGQDPLTLAARVGRPTGRQRFAPVVLEGDLTYAQLAAVEAHRYALPGVVVDLSPRRHYVQSSLAAHLLGTIGEIQRSQLQRSEFDDYRAGEIIGQRGLELLLEKTLRGKEGGRNLVVDVSGREIEVIGEVEPEPGGRVFLTIDLDLQRVAEEAFEPASPEEPGLMGALVALDPRTGDVLAWVSRPTYDPNAFSGGIDTETWGELIGDRWKPLQDRAHAGVFPPGSTYKPVVAAAGLAEGVVTPEDTVFCPGHWTLGRRTYRCWKRGGHGKVDLHDALKFSCDVYFYQLGVKLGIDTIARYARALGLGQLTGIDFPGEKAGLVPTQEWKERVKREPWLKGETVSAAIGQGYNLVTPLQLARLYGALGTGELVKPRLVLRRETWDGDVIDEFPPEQTTPVAIPEETLAIVRAGLTAVVNGKRGTGGRARVPGVLVAGKTGTTQVVSLDVVKNFEKDEIPIQFRDHAVFGAFAPVEKPEIAIAVLIQHAGGGGGRVAAPIAQRVLARYFEKWPRPAPDAPEESVETAQVDTKLRVGASRAAD